MTYIVKIGIKGQDPSQSLERVRDTGRKLRNTGACSIFTPICREDYGRVDCYLYDVKVSGEELEKAFKDIGDPKAAQKSLDIEFKLIQQAGYVIESLSAEFKQPEDRLKKLFKWHIHYILNGLGCDNITEFSFYECCMLEFGVSRGLIQRR